MGVRPMPKRVVNLTLDSDLVDAIDKLRGDVPRSRFINRILREVLKSELA